MNRLLAHLTHHRIAHTPIDPQVVDIHALGKVYFEDTDRIQSIFRTDRHGQTVFNSSEQPEVLVDEGIYYTAFRFGNEWYYFDLRRGFELRILKHVGKRMPETDPYPLVNLGIHTPYELLNGSFLPQRWAHKAAFCSHTAIGIADRNTMAGCYPLQRACLEAGLTPIFGYTLRFVYEGEEVDAKIYVQTQQGLRHLLRIQKAIMVDSPTQTIPFDELLRRGAGNVLVMGTHASHWMSRQEQALAALSQAFDKLYYQVDLSSYKAPRIYLRSLEATKHYFHTLYGHCPAQPILLTDAYYLDAEDAPNKVILNKIAAGAAHEQSTDQYYKDCTAHRAAFYAVFDTDRWDVEALFRECCDATISIAQGATARFDTSRNYMPQYKMLPHEQERYGNTHQMFLSLLEEGLQRLVPPEEHGRYRRQMEQERYVIESTGNVDYLLVQYDTCRWARANGILVGCGRGSAAGSLLLYLLGITLIDPMRYQLIFERFIVPERAGLYPTQTTLIGEDIDSTHYVELTLDNGTRLRLDKDAQLRVRAADGTEQTKYADELEEGDEPLFDRRDQLFTLPTITV